MVPHELAKALERNYKSTGVLTSPKRITITGEKRVLQQ
jgi:hypothetical protein